MGVAGTRAGTAIEERTALRPAAVTVGSVVDAHTVYGGVAGVQIPVD
jgi:hypothetical protein